MQLPDTPVVLREAADPAEWQVVLQCGDGEALGGNVLQLRGCGLQVEPSLRPVESFNEQDGGLVAGGWVARSVMVTVVVRASRSRNAAPGKRPDGAGGSGAGSPPGGRRRRKERREVGSIGV